MTTKQKNAVITLLWLLLPLIILIGDYRFGRQEQPAVGTGTATYLGTESIMLEPVVAETPAGVALPSATRVDLDQMLYVPADQNATGLSDNKQEDSPADFYIDHQAVTVAQYVLFLNESTRHKWDCSEYDCLEMRRTVKIARPGLTFEGGQFEAEPETAARLITGVGERASLAYCQWAGKRLPTPEEWQLAIRHFVGDKSGPNAGWNPGWYLRCAYTPSG